MKTIHVAYSFFCNNRVEFICRNNYRLQFRETGDESSTEITLEDNLKICNIENTDRYNITN